MGTVTSCLFLFLHIELPRDMQLPTHNLLGCAVPTYIPYALPTDYGLRAPKLKYFGDRKLISILAFMNMMNMIK